MTIALDEIRGLACTLCEECWLIAADRTLDDALAALSLHMSRAHRTARFDIEIMTDQPHEGTKDHA